MDCSIGIFYGRHTRKLQSAAPTIGYNDLSQLSLSSQGVAPIAGQMKATDEMNPAQADACRSSVMPRVNESHE